MAHRLSLRLLAVVAIAIGLLAAMMAAPTSAQAARWTGTSTVTGTPLVGETLTVVNDPVGSSEPLTFSYQWKYVDGNLDIPGAGSGPTYDLTVDDVGEVIYVIVTANQPDYGLYVTATNMIGAIGLRPFDSPGEPFFSVAPEAGIPITVDVDAAGWAPTPDGFEYQWFEVTPANVTIELAGATTDTITPTDAQVGSYFYVRVTAIASGYQNYVTYSSFSLGAALQAFDVVPTPAITGTGLVGDPLTVSAAGWTPEPTTLSFEWFRGDDATTSVGTGAQYVPTSADVGHYFYVVLTASRDDFVSTITASSFSPTVALRPFEVADPPTITGTGIVGTPFTAALDTEAWTPEPTSVTYQWFREDTSEIVGATAATFVPTKELVGEFVYVVATAHRADYNSYVIGSAPSWTVRAEAAPPVLASTGAGLPVGVGLAAALLGGAGFLLALMTRRAVARR